MKTHKILKQSAFVALLAREWRLAKRKRTTLWITPAFVCIASAVLAFAFEAIANSNLKLNSALFFATNTSILMSFSSIINLDEWFARDSENGTLEIYALSKYSPLLFVCAKYLAFLLIRGLPTTAALAAAVIFYTPLAINPITAFLIALPIISIGIIAISAISAFIAALTLHADARAENALLLSFPLIIPPLLLTIACLENALKNAIENTLAKSNMKISIAVLDSITHITPSLLFLAGCCMLALALLPVSAFIIKNQN